MELFICEFCNKECKNKNSLTQHKIRCKLNPNKIKLPNRVGKNNGMFGKKAWNKGLNKSNNEIILQISNTLSNAYKIGKYKSTGKAKTYSNEQNRKQKISEFANKYNHFWKYKRKNRIKYNGYTFDSSYEVVVAKSLDENGIYWQKPKSFKYRYNNKIHTYTADFYLPDYNIYLDPKNDFLINNINPGTGYKDTDKIQAVSEQNNIKILILDKNNLTWDKIKNLIKLSKSDF